MLSLRRITSGYLMTVGVVFLFGYLVLGIREHGLWLFMTALNLPASLAIEPETAILASSLGWSLGAPAHVWTTQLACMAVNAAMLLGIASLLSKMERARTRSAALRWTFIVLAFVLTAAAAFVPVLFLLAATPLHDGSELPGPLLLYSTLTVSGGLGVLASWLTDRLLRRGSAANRGSLDR